MPPLWKEVEQANVEKRCELILCGGEVSKRISENGLDQNIFQIKHLNFLEISNTCLSEIPPSLGNLNNLTRLILRNNKLQFIPTEIGELKKMKFLDLSFNSIQSIPSEISTLTELQSLNLCNNKLSQKGFPSFEKLVHLVSLNIAHNDFEEIPSEVYHTTLIHFSEMIANNNKISAIPPNINALNGLKVLNLGENEITGIPGELGDCTKLKELNLKGNKIKDKRLVKLIDQCHIKQIMEYIRSHCPKAKIEDNKQAKSKKQAKQSKKAPPNDEIAQLLDQLKVLHVHDDVIRVISTPNVQEIRPYIICCIIRNVDFTKEASLKKFITLQTKLHDNICEKRTLATIATHDLSKITGDIIYDAKDPKDIQIMPLHRKTKVTAAKLYEQLNEEADALRKEKKKNTFSGVHKYLYLLKDKSQYPCLLDNTSGAVISFPPITNSEHTKVSDETKCILAEVTGNSLATCKKVMDTLLEETIKLNIGEPFESDEVDDDDEISKRNYLTVQQVKVVDEEGKLKVVYPSRTDITSDNLHVIRLN